MGEKFVHHYVRTFVFFAAATFYVLLNEAAGQVNMKFVNFL